MSAISLLIFPDPSIILHFMSWLMSANRLIAQLQKKFSSIWRHALLCAYAIFFAAVAPFVCWGSVGDPTHNHATAHFIFDEEITATNPHSSNSHGHDYCLHDPMLRHNRLAPERMAAPPSAEPETRSTPLVTLIVLLVALYFATKEILFNAVEQIGYHLLITPFWDNCLLVPTPPPRYHPLASV